MGSSTSYLFEPLADRCPLTSAVTVDDLIETFKHRASWWVDEFELFT